MTNVTESMPRAAADDPRLAGLAEVLAVMDRLRGEGGCPWDREQDARSLRPFLVEEAYELLEALEEEDATKIKEELGDVLFQVFFHSRLAQESGRYDVGAVAHGIADKLVRRHPHVFAGKGPIDTAGVLATWEQHKKKEGRKSALDGVPRGMPALLRAQRLQEKAARTGFDWKDARGPMEKLDEELREVREALAKGDEEEARAELGDLLFSVVNLARHLGTNAEDVLARSAGKFERRFRSIESRAEEAGRELKSMPQEELDRLWDAAKADERSP